MDYKPGDKVICIKDYPNYGFKKGNVYKLVESTSRTTNFHESHRYYNHYLVVLKNETAKLDHCPWIYHKVIFDYFKPANRKCNKPEWF